MITENLFDTVLVEPVKQGANQLYIISGYATSAMAFNHLKRVHEINSNFSIKLIVGMSIQDGLSESNHRGFQSLMEEQFPKNFECSYVTNQPCVHSKVYSWYQDKNPLQGFLGSANYTQTAFSKNRREAMGKCCAADGLSYFQNLEQHTIYCTHIDAENLINIYNDNYYKQLQRQEKVENILELDDQISQKTIINGLPHIQISLLQQKPALEQVPLTSGLNWGQRNKREPNQAYLSLSADVYKSNFFPDRTIHFTVCTDDHKILVCTRAQANGKGIHTPHNNSLIGLYFRNRLGLPSGAPVTIEDLRRYGRTDVDFYKIDDETYFMDFSV